MTISALKGGLIVSCQARPGNPLRKPEFMAVMAEAAELGGAVGIRARDAEDIRAIRGRCSLPIIGLRKIYSDTSDVYITPTFDDARIVVEAGASIVALDGTDRPRPDGVSRDDLIRRIRDELGVAVMADVNSVRSGVGAAAAGAELVATTLSGYTGDVVPDEPDLSLVSDLAKALDVPVIAEGRLWTVEDVRAAFAAGAYAVVVGTAVTNPMAITARLRRGTPSL